jgi:hypothetical protein
MAAAIAIKLMNIGYLLVTKLRFCERAFMP